MVGRFPPFTICHDCKVNPVLAPTCTMCRECWILESKSIDEMVRVLDARKPAVNNHICPHCNNDRVSKSERSCWKCGGSL